MDPNANLKEQDELARSWEAAGIAGGTPDRDERQRMRDLRESLSDWLARGGFAPDWDRYPAGTRAFRKWHKQIQRFADLAR